MASYRQGVSPMEPVGEGQLVLVIEPVPGNVPAVNRLRRLLKVMLRGYGWRCVHVGRREPATVVYVERKKRTRPAKPCPDR